MVILSEGETIDIVQVENLLPQLAQADPGGTLKAATEQFEREYIKRALARAEGNMTRAAEILGLERSHLYKKLRSLGLENSDK